MRWRKAKGSISVCKDCQETFWGTSDFCTSECEELWDARGNRACADCNKDIFVTEAVYTYDVNDQARAVIRCHECFRKYELVIEAEDQRAFDEYRARLVKELIK